MTIAPEDIGHFLQALSLGVLGVLSWFVRYYFQTIQNSLKDLATRFDTLDKRSDRHQTQIAIVETELTAVWRTLGMPKRMSDIYNGEEDS